MTSRHILTCFLPQIANCYVMLESSKLFIINAIIILYMDHLISTYLFLHLTKGKFGITKIHLRYIYSVQFHSWIGMTSSVTKRQMKKLKILIRFLIRLSNSTKSIPTGWILKLFHPWEIGPNWPKDITLIQLKRIKTFSPLNQTRTQK